MGKYSMAGVLMCVGLGSICLTVSAYAWGGGWSNSGDSGLSFNIEQASSSSGWVASGKAIESISGNKTKVMVVSPAEASKIISDLGNQNYAVLSPGQSITKELLQSPAVQNALNEYQANTDQVHISTTFQNSEAEWYDSEGWHDMGEFIMNGGSANVVFSRPGGVAFSAESTLPLADWGKISLRDEGNPDAGRFPKNAGMVDKSDLFTVDKITAGEETGLKVYVPLTKQSSTQITIQPDYLLGATVQMEDLNNGQTIYAAKTDVYTEVHFGAEGQYRGLVSLAAMENKAEGEDTETVSAKYDPDGPNKIQRTYENGIKLPEQDYANPSSFISSVVDTADIFVEVYPGGSSMPKAAMVKYSDLNEIQESGDVGVMMKCVNGTEERYTSRDNFILQDIPFFLR